MTKIQEMATDCLKQHLMFWSNQCGLDRLLTLQDCTSPNSYVGQIITEFELRKTNGSNGDGKYYSIFLSEEIKK